MLTRFGNIYLSGRWEANSKQILNRIQPKVIVNVSKIKDKKLVDCEYKQFPLDSRYLSGLNKKAIRIIRFIQRRESKGRVPIVVHCVMGINRSPAIVALYLALNKGYKFSKSVRKVKKRHRKMNANSRIVNLLANGGMYA